MKDLNSFSNIYIATNAVDFRKQHHGLSAIVKNILDESPFKERSIFVFINKSKTAVKLLYWDETGFALWSKILEKDRFRWFKKDSSEKISLSAKELKWLLQGIDISKLKKHEKLNFSEVF